MSDTREQNMEIARTILAQLGGRQAQVMMGMQNMVAVDNGLQFKFKGCPAYNCLRIILNAMDLYEVTFFKLRKFSIVDDLVVDNVHVEDLRGLIEEKTGLYLSLGTFGKVAS